MVAEDLEKKCFVQASYNVSRFFTSQNLAGRARQCIQKELDLGTMQGSV